MENKIELLKSIIENSKSRTRWAFDFIRKQPNFREELLPRMNFLYSFYINDLCVNLHPEFWIKNLRMFEISEDDFSGKELVYARNIIRSIDDYKQYLINKENAIKNKEKQDQEENTEEKSFFDKQAEEKEKQEEKKSNSEDDPQEDVSYGQVYNSSKTKKFYGNYYKEYGKDKKKKTASKKDKKIDYYTKPNKKSTKKRSNMIKSY